MGCYKYLNQPDRILFSFVDDDNAGEVKVEPWCAD